MKHTPLETVRASRPFAAVVDRCRRLTPGSELAISGVAGSLDALILAGIHAEIREPVIAIASDRQTAERLRDDLITAAGRETVHLFLHDHHLAGGDHSREAANVQAIRALAAGPPPILVTHPPSLLVPLPDPDRIAGRAFSVTAGEPVEYADVVTRLRTLGFQKADIVGSRGDYAVRGGIIDVFPFVGDNPVRIEFAGDEVESIREFDPLSQRSIRQLSAAQVVADIPAEDDDRTLFDFLPADSLVVVDSRERLAAALETEKRTQHDGHAPDLVMEALSTFRILIVLPVRQGGEEVVDFGARPQSSFNASVALFRSEIAALQKEDYSVLVACGSQSEASRLKELLVNVGLEPGDEDPGPDMSRIIFALEAVHEGFVFPVARLALYTEHQVFNRIRRRGEKRRGRFRGMSDRELYHLRRGDYVVHQEFGIGRFDSLQRLAVSGVDQEVVKVLYESKDTLYVNLNALHKLQKYSSREGHVPRLTRLGSPDWDRLRARVKKRVKDIARELILLYAKRRATPGLAFPADTPWQKELEASFLYEDTFDQAKATLEVKQDMEREFPMDRLVCGDVGFGKTEVAVRAAFKAVLAGKQSAVLVPTTILAMQHYNTFLDRTARYGVQVRVLSRFKGRKEQQAVLRELKEGKVDIVIGTHRLLSKDVAFKNLGLLIIDEEHRFGVRAKEHLRRLRAEVDTLTLTATPIPRTLHFSLLGARDLSIIATPPRNRLPILTEVTQWNDDLIREAVHRELQRGGQVYVVHDRVQTIEQMSERLKATLPGVRIRSAHGQLPARELEEVMMNFLEKRFDVLLATKIIESGLDIPNVNTIIVNRADRFGMAELHQLRGRVGRGNVQAYAYLIVPPLSVLPRVALQRLQAVQEFTELGAGFNLSMRDLEIRGAGNLLGSEQSGFIEAMGFETYTRILDEAVQELKEQEFNEVFAGAEAPGRGRQPTVVEPGVGAYIPASYVDSDTDRLSVYRRLFTIETSAQLDEIAEELADRFGPFPEEVVNLFDAVRLRMAGARLGFPRLAISDMRFEVEFPPQEDSAFYEGDRFQQLMRNVSSMKEQGAMMRQDGKTLRVHFDLERVAGGETPLRSALMLIDKLQAPPS